MTTEETNSVGGKRGRVLAEPKIGLVRTIVDVSLVSAYAFSLVFFSYKEGLTYVAKLAGVSIGFLFLFRIVASAERPRCPREFVLLAAWLFIAAISGVFSLNFNVFFDTFLTLLQVMGIAYAVFNIVTWIKNPLAPLLGIYLATLAMAFMVFRNPLPYTVEGRLTGTLGNANLFGLALLTSIIYAINRLFSLKSKVLKLAFLSSGAFLIYMLGLTGSRKGIISVILFFLIYSVIRFWSDIRKKPSSALIVVILMLSFSVGSVILFRGMSQFQRTERVIEAIQHKRSTRADGSVQDRISLYRKGWRLIWQHPVIGVGLNNFMVAFDRRGLTRFSYAHSNLIEIAVGTGLIGFVVYYSIYLSLFVRLLSCRTSEWVSRQRESFFCICALFIIIALYDFAMVSYYEKLSWLIMTSLISGTFLFQQTSYGKMRDQKTYPSCQ